jgi:hypothetical protein
LEETRPRGGTAVQIGTGKSPIQEENNWERETRERTRVGKAISI